MAGVGSRHDAGVRGGRRASGALPRRTARRWSRCRGRVTVPATPATSMTGGVVGGAALEDGGDRVDAGRVAHGRLDHHPGQQRHRRAVDRLDGLRRIGIDEISYKRGHRYLTVVVDHDSGRLVWAGPGRDDATLAISSTSSAPNAPAAHPCVSGHGRLDRPSGRQASPERGALRRSVPCRCLGHRSARRRTPPGMEPGSGDATRPPVRSGGKATGASPGTLKRPLGAVEEPRTTSPAANEHQLEWIAETDPRLQRAYLLKEGLRYVFAVKGDRRQTRPRPMALLGPPVPNPAFVDLARRSQTPARSTPPWTRACPTHSSSRPTPRSASSPESPSVPRTRTPHRPRHAHPRRPPTRPSRPNMTHGSSRRAPISAPLIVCRRPAQRYEVCSARRRPGHPGHCSSDRSGAHRRRTSSDYSGSTCVDTPASRRSDRMGVGRIPIAVKDRPQSL